MKFWKRAGVATTVAFLYYAAQISAAAQPMFRYHYQWETKDALAIVLGIAALVVLAVAADAMVRWLAFSWGRRVFNHLFLLCFAVGVLNVAFFISNRLHLIQLLWLPLMFMIGFSFARPERRLYRYAANFCVFISPGVVLVLAILFFWSNWPNRQGALPPADSAAAGKTPVFFFVFDEWSYARSSEADAIRPSLKNLRKLADRSEFFTRVRSPAPETEQSLPRYLFQNDLTFAVDSRETYFESDNGLVPTRQCSSLFTMARERGYRSAVLGFYHSYRQLLGDDVDYCGVYPHFFDNRKDSLLHEVWWRMVRTTAYSSDPISLKFQMYDRMQWYPWFKTVSAYRQEMMGLLGNATQNDFYFFHVPWPHGPFVFNADGSFYEGEPDASRASDYLRHLEFLDSTVGEITAKLEAAGQYDDALLILTSDHGWRADNNYIIEENPEFKRRVPLIIKLPGQRTGHVIDTRFCANRLRPLFDAVFAGEKDPDKLLKILEQTVAEAK